MNGILDMEELADIPDKNKYEKRYANGPFRFEGSEQFVIMYRYGDLRTYRMRIYQLPDSTQVSLINDHQEKIDFSTFRNDTNILMSVNNRYVLFDKDGIFRDEIEFKALDEPKKALNIPIFKRMKLFAMSSNNKYFLFED